MKEGSGGGNSAATTHGVRSRANCSNLDWVTGPQTLADAVLLKLMFWELTVPFSMLSSWVSPAKILAVGFFIYFSAFILLKHFSWSFN